MPAPLNISQRALLAARKVEQFSSAAKQRQKAGIRVSDGHKGKAAELAAKEFSVSPRQVELGLVILRYGDPVIVEWIEYGEVTIRNAVELISVERRLPWAIALIEDWLNLCSRAFNLDKKPFELLEELKNVGRPKVSVREFQYCQNRDPKLYPMPGRLK